MKTFTLSRLHNTPKTLQNSLDIHRTFKGASHLENLSPVPVRCLKCYSPTQARDMQQPSIIQHYLTFAPHVYHAQIGQDERTVVFRGIRIANRFSYRLTTQRGINAVTGIFSILKPYRHSNNRQWFLFEHSCQPLDIETMFAQ